MFSCTILKDSKNIENGCRLTTFEISFPRIILAEYNTHRMLSRNSASSRAIPVEKIIKRVMEDPFIPIRWGKNQKGMQASVDLSLEEIEAAKIEWLKARDYAVAQARFLLGIGVHKQITNRLLEPFMWQTVITSGTEWQNLFALRDHKDAQPEFKVIAGMMKEALASNIPDDLAPGEWHLPLIKEEELEEIISRFGIEGLKKVSTGRCTRVSYLTHMGVRDLQADIDLCEMLQKDGHMSPFEHPAMAFAQSDWIGNFQGFKQYRKFIPNENIFGSEIENEC
jgi:thymidylate synthase ThyX